MFYVANGKVYSTVFNETLGVYPEMKLAVTVQDGERTFNMKQLTTGVTTKPAKRQLCTVEEVFAQFGADARLEPESEIKPDLGTPKAAKPVSKHKESEE